MAWKNDIISMSIDLNSKIYGDEATVILSNKEGKYDHLKTEDFAENTKLQIKVGYKETNGTERMIVVFTGLLTEGSVVYSPSSPDQITIKVFDRWKNFVKSKYTFQEFEGYTVKELIKKLATDYMGLTYDDDESKSELIFNIFSNPTISKAKFINKSIYDIMNQIAEIVNAEAFFDADTKLRIQSRNIMDTAVKTYERSRIVEVGHSWGDRDIVNRVIVRGKYLKNFENRTGDKLLLGEGIFRVPVGINVFSGDTGRVQVPYAETTAEGWLNYRPDQGLEIEFVFRIYPCWVSEITLEENDGEKWVEATHFSYEVMGVSDKGIRILIYLKEGISKDPEGFWTTGGFPLADLPLFYIKVYGYIVRAEDKYQRVYAEAENSILFDKYGFYVDEVIDSELIETNEQAEDIAKFRLSLHQCEQEKPTLQVPCNPLLERGDLITVIDTRTGIEESLLIRGIRHDINFQTGKATTNLNCYLKWSRIKDVGITSDVKGKFGVGSNNEGNTITVVGTSIALATQPSFTLEVGSGIQDSTGKNTTIVEVIDQTHFVVADTGLVSGTGIVYTRKKLKDLFGIKLKDTFK